MTTERFPIDLGAYRPLAIDPQAPELSPEQKDTLLANIRLCRDAIVFFTATGAARGVGGHTGGPYDTVPEVMLLEAFFRGAPERFVPIVFDEAGHRVATQYLLAVLHGHLPAEQLLHYREAHSRLPGHPASNSVRAGSATSGPMSTAWPSPTRTRWWCASAPTAPSRRATTPRRPASPWPTAST
jgi:hypothetical protein